MLCLVAMACATVFESMHGTERALHEFYRSRWFEALLWLLSVNVLVAMVVRFPFSRRQIGFVLTHGAILVTLFGALVTKHWGINQGRVGIPEGQAVSSFTIPQPVLIAASRLDGSRASIELPERVFGGFEIVEDPSAPTLELGPLTASVEWYLPDGQWSRRVVNDNPEPQLALSVSLSFNGHAHPTWVFADETVRLEGTNVTLTAVESRTELERAVEEGASQADIELIAGPGDELRLRRADAADETEIRRIEIGTPIVLEPSGRRLTVTQRYDHARTARAFTPVEPIREMRDPGIYVKLAAGEETHTLWLSKFRPSSLTVAGVPYELVFGHKTLPLGFEVRLDRFRIGHYPGTRRPRSFESTITIIDSQRGGEQTRVVSMNHPVEYGGWTFYQSSYQERPRVTTILSVARDAGQPIVFAGYVLLTVGMLWVLVQRIALHRMSQRPGHAEPDRDATAVELTVPRMPGQYGGDNRSGGSRRREREPVEPSHAPRSSR
jgi:hypothetical protein